jgi:putative transcriptional regulator
VRSKSSRLFPLLAALGVLISAAATAQEPPAGLFLVASPRILDPNFRETVVLMLQHTPLVSRGVIINRPLDVPLSRLMPGDEVFAKLQDPVYFGGPVALAHLSFVFRADARHKGGVLLMDDLYFGESPGLLKELLRRKSGAAALRVYAGHAGWGPGQLQSEIESGSWFMTRASPGYILHQKPDSIWAELVKQASLRPARAEPHEIRGSSPRGARSGSTPYTFRPTP